MGLIDNKNNEEIQKILDNHDIEPPKYWVGDMVKLIPNWEDKFIETMNRYHPTINAHDSLPDPSYDFTTSQNYEVQKKYLHDAWKPWWSLLKNKNNREYYFLDECLSVRPLYRPRKMVYESYDEFVKQMK